MEYFIWKLLDGIGEILFFLWVVAVCGVVVFSISKTIFELFT